MLTALLLLEATEVEQKLIDKLKANPASLLPELLIPFITKSTEDPLLQLILKNIEREDLNEEECQLAMSHFFGDAPDYLQAALLEAQRLKRETFIENRSFFQAFWQKSKRETVTLPVVLDISNNYDGNIRVKNYSLLTSKLLAAFGLPTIIHAVEKVAPKNGLSTNHILQALNHDPLVSLTDSVKELQESNWTYSDQATFFPELAQKTHMRQEMVKRPFIATFEKLMQPIQAEGGNYVITGYTHKHYKNEVPKLLQEQGQSKKALVVKGEEGSAQLPVHKASEYVLFDGTSIQEGVISPEDFGIELVQNTDRSEITAKNVVKNMQAALAGENDFVKWQVIYNAAAIISLFDLAPKDQLVTKLEKSFHNISL